MFDVRSFTVMTMLYALGLHFSTVTREDMLTLKNDWLTDNVGYLTTE
jgi:hypothetical protein